MDQEVEIRSPQSSVVSVLTMISMEKIMMMMMIMIMMMITRVARLYSLSVSRFLPSQSSLHLPLPMSP